VEAASVAAAGGTDSAGAATGATAVQAVVAARATVWSYAISDTGTSSSSTGLTSPSCTGTTHAAAATSFAVCTADLGFYAKLRVASKLLITD